MAPPDKDVMGTRLSIPTDPPGPGEPTPLREGAKPKLPRPATKAATAPPSVAVDPDEPPLEQSAKPPYVRKDSPPGGLRIEGPGGWKVSAPQALVLAVLTCLGGAGVAAKAASSESGDRAEVMAELRSIREELKGLRTDVREVRDEQASARRDDKKILTYTENTFTPIVASLRRLGVKLEYEGSDRAADVDFHPAPGPGSTAPPIQPKAVLPDRPSL